MVPLVATRPSSPSSAADRPHRQAVFEEQGASVEYLVGTMIELPRAA
jgi:pyruvate,orthophosphate dikinase